MISFFAIIGKVASYQYLKTKSNKDIISINIENEGHSLPILFFKNIPVFIKGDMVKITGNISKNNHINSYGNLVSEIALFGTFIEKFNNETK